MANDVQHRSLAELRKLAGLIGGELAWLLMQARSRTPSQEERALLDPISRLIAQKKSVREEEADYE